MDVVIGRLFGLQRKMPKYAEGEKFVRAVVDAVGMEGFNRVWDGPHNLPTQAEIADPAAWVARVATPADEPVEAAAAPPKRTRRKPAAEAADAGDAGA